MRAFTIVFLVLVLPPRVWAQSQCANTLAWNDPTCQLIQSGSLGPNWTVISRHGEYAQSETECNIPSAVTQAPGAVTITTTATPYTCGNFNADGTVNTTPQSWPYSTGDIQFASFNFSPNGSGGSADCKGTCTLTVVGSMPASNTNLWPAYWLLGSNCQDSNKWSGDTGFDNCPNLGASGYTEIDTTECYNSGGWCQFHVANPSFGIGNGCDAQYQVDTKQHTFTTVWTASSIQQFMDGTLETTCNQSLTNPMFFIAQIQTGGTGGTPSNNHLPASMVLNSVTITDANGTVLFSDDFQGTPDAGTTDAGSTDAGSTDAGSGQDAGSTLDAGTRPDSGSPADGGTPGKVTSGCGCGAGTPSPLVLLAALGLIASRRRMHGSRLSASTPC